MSIRSSSKKSAKSKKARTPRGWVVTHESWPSNRIPEQFANNEDLRNWVNAHANEFGLDGHLIDFSQINWLTNYKWWKSKYSRRKAPRAFRVRSEALSKFRIFTPKYALGHPQSPPTPPSHSSSLTNESMDDTSLGGESVDTSTSTSTNDNEAGEEETSQVPQSSTAKQIASQLGLFLKSRARGEQMKLYSQNAQEDNNRTLEQAQAEKKRFTHLVDELRQKAEVLVVKDIELYWRRVVNEPLAGIYVDDDIVEDGPNMNEIIEKYMNNTKYVYIGVTKDPEEAYERHSATLPGNPSTMVLIAWTKKRTNSGMLEKSAIKYARAVEEKFGCQIENIKDGGQGISRYGRWYIYFLYLPTCP